MAPYCKHFLEIALPRSPLAISVRLYAMYRTPLPPLKLSHRYASEVDFEIYEILVGPLVHYMAHDVFLPNPPLGQYKDQHGAH